MEIIDYKLISSTKLGYYGNGAEIKYVEDQVKESLLQGWFLYGPIVLSTKVYGEGSVHMVYVQTMVKYKVAGNDADEPIKVNI